MRRGPRGAAALLLLPGAMAAADPGTVPRTADAGDAAAILRRAEEIRSPSLDYVVDFTLRVEDPQTAWKERTSRYTMIARGKDYSLVLMREPKLFYPGTLLIMQNLYWMLLPRADRPFQLSAQHVFNGDISNGDLARGNLLRHYTPRLDGEESLDGARCRRLELTRSDAVPYYPRVRYWAEKRTGRPRRLEYYGKTGDLLKTVRYGGYRKGALGVRPMRLEVGTPTRPGETTTLTFDAFRPVDAGGLPFTTEGMTAFRDAARRRFEAEGEQAPSEDLPGLLAAGAR